MFKLQAEAREALGKDNAVLRQGGLIPAVVYGGKKENKNISVSLIDFNKTFHQAGESSLISLTVGADAKPLDVLVHDVQYSPLTDEPVHVDFYVVDQDKEIEVNIPLIFIGEAPAVKELGGSLVKVLHELPIKALPKNLPHDLSVDVSSLTTMESQILVKDLNLSSGVTAAVDGDEVVASITKAGEEVLEEETPVDLSAIEVEKKGKKEEEGAEGEAKTEAPAEK